MIVVVVVGLYFLFSRSSSQHPFCVRQSCNVSLHGMSSHRTIAHAKGNERSSPRLFLLLCSFVAVFCCPSFAMFGFLFVNQPAALLGRRILAAPTTFMGNVRSAAAVGSPLSSWELLLQPSLLLCRGKHTLKTNRSVAKRFRVKGNGTLKR